jgi:N-acetylmuramoyl-L-alanine amidase
VVLFVCVVIACVLVAASGGAPGQTTRPAPAGAAQRASLHGRVIVLDPGHNGGNVGAARDIAAMVEAGGFSKACDTVGASTDAGYPEHAFNFDVATRVAALLRDRGAEVILTRSGDDGVGPCVDERARIGNNAGADAVVSIHADGADAEGSGFHVIAPARSPDGGNESILADSARLADALRESFASTGEPMSDYVGHSGLDARADLAGLNLSRVPKVFLECANMRNPVDAARVADPTWRQHAAAGIADGIAAYLTS